MVPIRSEKPICDPPHLSAVSPALPLKHFQCSNDASMYKLSADAYSLCLQLGNNSSNRHLQLRNGTETIQMEPNRFQCSWTCLKIGPHACVSNNGNRASNHFLHMLSTIIGHKSSVVLVPRSRVALLHTVLPAQHANQSWVC